MILIIFIGILNPYCCLAVVLLHMDPNYGFFYDSSVKTFYVAWRRTIRKLWVLPNTTHCKYRHTINNSLPIDLMLEKRCLKCIWSCINSSNTIVKSVSSICIWICTCTCIFSKSSYFN